MRIIPVEVSAEEISGADGLDAIHVFWVDDVRGRGYVTIICYGAAWTAYFGAMGDRTIRQFFAEVDVDYLVNKMGIGPHLKQTKRDNAYLAKIIKAVKVAIDGAGGAA